MLNNIRGYTPIRQIGTGGFGEVYVAKQEVINREVAIKVILPLYANRDDFIRRFQFEAELVAKLEHPHIVPIYDYWRDPNGAYLVMRYIKGGNLADMLVKDGPMDIVSASRMLSQIAEALHTAHRAKVIHQDIKPANIMLDGDGNAYLTDFGIARDIEANVNLAEDDSNTMHGSPKYISPEHLRRREITPRSDIYSLGLVMYEMLTGSPPFEHDDMLQLLQMHVRRDLPSLQSKKDSLPEALNYPLQQATLKDPLQRYDSVLQFAQDFQQVVAGQGLSQTQTIPFPSTWSVEATGPIETRNPYKGLKAFRESDSDDFYGRDELVQKLIKSFATSGKLGRFMAVVGPSGSGKSSVVRAGLIPAIRNEEIMGLPTQYISTMIPGSNPVRSLEGAILKVASRASVSLMETIAQTSYDLHEVLSQSLPENGEMLLLIDQFEELFTLVTDEEVRRNFLKMIYNALTVDGSRLRVIATLRADFFDRPLSYPDWGVLFRERTEVIPPMSSAELRAAIEEPARANGLALEQGLSGIIIADVNSQVGVLPLLQYTLSELYERRNGIELTVEAYDEIGGISGALAKRADEIYATLNDQQRIAARLFFTRLIRIGERQDHTRQRVLLGEIYSLNLKYDVLQSIIDTFGKYRLLTFDNETNSRLPTVEVAHEALIRSWDLLREWIEDNTDALRLQSRLSDEAKLWHEQGKDNSYLATGLRLEQFSTLENNDMIALTKRENDYLYASMQLADAKEARERSRRRFVQALYAVIAVAGIIAIIAAIAAVQQRNVAVQALQDEEIARQEADANALESRARELAASSLLYAENQPDRAILLALESIGIQSTFEGRNALLSSILTQQRLVGYYYGHTSNVRAITISPDQSLIATAGADGSVIIWDAEQGFTLFELQHGDQRANVVAFSPDSSQVISADATGTVVVWSATTGDRLQDLSFNTQEIRSASFSPDGTIIAIGNSNGEIIWWSAIDYQQLGLVEAHDGEIIYDLEFSPDGTHMATGGDDNTIHLWNWDGDNTSLQQVIVGHEDGLRALAFSRDGSQLASGGADFIVGRWDVATGDNLSFLRAHTREVTGLAYSGDGETLVSAGFDGNIVLWDADNGEFIEFYTNLQQQRIQDIATADNTLLVASDRPEIVAFEIIEQPRFGTTIATASEDIISSALHDNGTVAYAGGVDEDFTVYVIENGAEEAIQLEHHTGIVTDMVWMNDQLVTVSVDRTAAIWSNNELIDIIIPADSPISVATSGDHIALGLNNGMIEVYTRDASGDWALNSTLTDHSRRVTALEFSPDGTQLISGSLDMSIIVWDISTGTAIGDPLTSHTDAIEAIRFSPDGRIFASGSRDESIILWSADTREPIGAPLQRHENWVTDLAFTPDSTILVSVSLDRTAILWNVPLQRVLGLPFFGHDNAITTVNFSADGTYFVTSSLDRSLIRWQIDQSNWIEISCDIVNRSLNEIELTEYFAQNYEPKNICDTINEN